MRRRLRSLGASQETLRLVESGHRPSTQTVYACHWARWYAWCVKHNVSAISPTEIDLANHLAQLSTVHSLSPSCMRVRRSAILTTLRQLGYPLDLSSSVVHDVIRGAAAIRVRVAPCVPKWDLFLLLAFLREPRFEPLEAASLVNLTRKTVFLLTLATARRISEIHAISGLPSDVAYLPDGSLELMFLPEFLAKNQVPGDASPVISIPTLDTVTCPDDPDRSNCPVRALRIYRRRTESKRKAGQRCLFMSINPNHTKDVRKNTLARWISNLIKEAYSWAISKDFSYLPLIAPKTHEIRAWSASLGHANNVPMGRLLQAAYWRSEDIFINHYLRDSARLRDDGTLGVRSLVAAQTTLSSLRT